MKPSARYENHITKGLITSSVEQLKVLQILDEYYANFKSINSGIYLWGSVGSGKTMLLDIFYNSIDIEKKQRMHFHEFISKVHSDLKNIASKKDPLRVVTKDIAKNTKVLFLDELIIDDISNAVILKNLFVSLAKQGVFIMTSSNTAPCNLYEYGINRELFLPAIEFIEENFTVIELSSKTDYRGLGKTDHKNYIYPITDKNEQKILELFNLLNPDTNAATHSITICSRDIEAIKITTQSAWFDFESIICPPRSYEDYLYLGSNFTNIFISNVRPICESEVNLIYNFCHLIDICYDKEIRLCILAKCTLDEIFEHYLDSKTILRTKSRLKAME